MATKVQALQHGLPGIREDRMISSFVYAPGERDAMRQQILEDGGIVRCECQSHHEQGYGYKRTHFSAVSEFTSPRANVPSWVTEDYSDNGYYNGPVICSARKAPSVTVYAPYEADDDGETTYWCDRCMDSGCGNEQSFWCDGCNRDIDDDYIRFVDDADYVCTRCYEEELLRDGLTEDATRATTLPLLPIGYRYTEEQLAEQDWQKAKGSDALRNAACSRARLDNLDMYRKYARALLDAGYAVLLTQEPSYSDIDVWVKPYNGIDTPDDEPMPDLSVPIPKGTFYKVLKLSFSQSRTGSAFIVGTPLYGDKTFAWSLPTYEPNTNEWTPGGWHQHDGPLDICHSGLHLTVDPTKWRTRALPQTPGEADAVFEAEWEGPIEEVQVDGDKICVRRARLLRRVSWERFHAASYDDFKEVPNNKIKEGA